MAAGVLVVQKVIPGSCAEGHVEPGDVLTRVHSGRKGAADFASFVSFEELLDDSVRIYCRKPWLPALLRAVPCAQVGGEVTLQLERRGEPLEVRSAKPASTIGYS